MSPLPRPPGERDATQCRKRGMAGCPQNGDRTFLLGRIGHSHLALTRPRRHGLGNTASATGIGKTVSATGYRQHGIGRPGHRQHGIGRPGHRRHGIGRPRHRRHGTGGKPRGAPGHAIRQRLAVTPSARWIPFLLTRAKSRHGIGSRSSSRRDITRGDGNHGQNGQHSDEGNRVGGSDSE